MAALLLAFPPGFSFAAAERSDALQGQPAERRGGEPGQLPAAVQPASGYALRFFGSGRDGVDRVTVRIDGAGNPANVGGDFTLEFWLKALPGENRSGPCRTGADAWTNGNIIVDRDIFGPGDDGDYGISLFGGVIAFGVAVGSAGASLCGTTRVDDGAWHHVAVTRRRADGRLQLFVDGRLDASVMGPSGSVAYRSGRASSWPNDPYLVLGAEKHDYDPAAYPSFRGWLDELRLSTVVRYAAPFTPPAAPFAPDASTALLFHFDEGPEGPCTGTVVDSAPGGRSAGVCAFGGLSGGGPRYVRDTPFQPANEPPRVVSITRADPNPAAGGSLRFRVLFSAPVEQVDPADFALTVLSGGFASLSVAEVAGADAAYTVTALVGAGAGLVRLDVPASATIVDGAGRPLAGLPFTAGEAYLLPRDRQFAPLALLRGSPAAN
ncbi:MAG: LamG domain-containing protein [Chloroflexota bacterium]|nr:LamG domain-containing protein [Dehalococcoidia bacterium]MDW8252600.1 LamG domain-containing protein [Chloroflexota bacterium]